MRKVLELCRLERHQQVERVTDLEAGVSHAFNPLFLLGNVPFALGNVPVGFRKMP
ncbi:hypothetical protein [Bradyrhizobium sp. USDA 4451]